MAFVAVLIVSYFSTFGASEEGVFEKCKMIEEPFACLKITLVCVRKHIYKSA